MAAGDSFAGIAVPEGDPGELRGLAQTFSAVAGSMDTVSTTFRAFPAELSAWQGPASVAFAGASLVGGTGAASAGSALDGHARAIREYADELEAAQRKAERAIDDARDAQRRIDRALEAIADARQRQADARERAAGAEIAIAATGAIGAPSADAVAAREEAEGAAASAAADERRAHHVLEQAREDLERAKRQGEQAEEEAEQAAARAAAALGAIGGGGALGTLGVPGSATVGPAGLSLAPVFPFGLLPGATSGPAREAFGDLAPYLGVLGVLAAGSVFGDRQDRRVANDSRLRVPPGGRTGRTRGEGADFESDWAGRELLERYLTGGDDLTMENDPEWTAYMQANPILRDKLNVMVQKKALSLYDQYHSDDVVFQTFNDTGAMEIENGESISGYQYLHGTNADAGGFNFRGSAEITRVEGGYEVHIPATYTWNDIIDPNSQYRSDQIKSTIAEIVTLGRADGYELHLSWSSDATVRLDEHGNVVSVKGYPGE